jgi:hypothetical protein
MVEDIEIQFLASKFEEEKTGGLDKISAGTTCAKKPWTYA